MTALLLTALVAAAAAANVSLVALADRLSPTTSAPVAAGGLAAVNENVPASVLLAA